MIENWQQGGFGLYLHWPFCAAKCPYCDFNSHVSANVDDAKWQAAFEEEIDRFAEKTSGHVLSTVFFGGGTPSLMGVPLVEAILERVEQNWQLSNDFEVTLEANPTSVEAAKFIGFRDAGVNRVSLGLQALNDPDLKALGRLHSAQEGLAAFEVARSVFDRVSFDLIYSRQHQTLEAWDDELRRALALGVDHLSLYQLTIEPETAFGALQARGKLGGLPNDDLSADMFELTRKLCAENGLVQYEVSNFARAGHEAQHNLIYWNYGDYGGIGPGAHGRFSLGETRYSTVQKKWPADWLGGQDRETLGIVDRDEQFTEYLLMGLRTRQGVSTQRFSAHMQALQQSSVFEHLCDIGMIEHVDGYIRATDQGMPLLNEILRQLLS